MNISKLLSSYDEPQHDPKILDIKVKLFCGHVNEYPHLAIISILMTKKNALRCYECNPN